MYVYDAEFFATELSRLLFPTSLFSMCVDLSMLYS